MVLLGSSVRLGQITSADSAAATGTGPRRVRLFCRFRESYRVASDWSRHLELDWLEGEAPRVDTLDGKVDIIAELVLPDSSSAEWAGKSTDTIEDVRVFIGSAWAPDIQLEEPSDAAPAAPATVPESPPQQRAATTMAAFLSDDIPLSPASPRRAPSPPPAPGTTVASLFSDMRPVALSDNPLFGILSPPPAEPPPSRRLAVEANMEPIELAKLMEEDRDREIIDVFTGRPLSEATVTIDDHLPQSFRLPPIRYAPSPAAAAAAAALSHSGADFSIVSPDAPSAALLAAEGLYDLAETGVAALSHSLPSGEAIMGVLGSIMDYVDPFTPTDDGTDPFEAEAAEYLAAREREAARRRRVEQEVQEADVLDGAAAEAEEERRRAEPLGPGAEVLVSPPEQAPPPARSSGDGVTAQPAAVAVATATAVAAATAVVAVAAQVQEQAQQEQAMAAALPHALAENALAPPLHAAVPPADTPAAATAAGPLPLRPTNGDLAGGPSASASASAAAGTAAAAAARRGSDIGDGLASAMGGTIPHPLPLASAPSPALSAAVPLCPPKSRRTSSIGSAALGDDAQGHVLGQAPADSRGHQRTDCDGHASGLARHGAASSASLADHDRQLSESAAGNTGGGASSLPSLLAGARRRIPDPDQVAHAINLVAVALDLASGWQPLAALVAVVTIVALGVRVFGYTVWCTLAVGLMYMRLAHEERVRASMTDELRNAKAEVGAAHKQIAATVAALARADEMHALGTIDPSSGAAQGGLSVRGLTGLSGGIMGGYGGYGRGLTADSEAVWLNSLLAANWGGWLATWLSNLLRGTVRDALKKGKPVFLDSVDLVALTLDEKPRLPPAPQPPRLGPPQIVHSRRAGASGAVLLDITLQVEELILAMRIAAKLTVLNATVDLPVTFRAAGADVQVHLEFQNKAPYVSEVKVSLLDLPRIDVSIRPGALGGLDVVDLPGVDQWLQGALDDALRRTLVEPKAFMWNVQGWWDERKRQESAGGSDKRQ